MMKLNPTKLALLLAQRRFLPEWPALADSFARDVQRLTEALKVKT
jgi:hypothetical protein